MESEGDRITLTGVPFLWERIHNLRIDLFCIYIKYDIQFYFRSHTLLLIFCGNDMKTRFSLTCAGNSLERVIIFFLHVKFSYCFHGWIKDISLKNISCGGRSFKASFLHEKNMRTYFFSDFSLVMWMTYLHDNRLFDILRIMFLHILSQQKKSEDK